MRLGLFNTAEHGAPISKSERASRHSSGWAQMLQHLKAQPELRVLDVGPTSPNNINYLTSLGHSVYMVDLVEDAARPEWLLPQEDGSPAKFDVERFLAANLDFSGRGFDVVLFWDTADYLPESLVGPVLERLHQVMYTGAYLLAFFHTRAEAPGTAFCRYNLTDSDSVEIQAAATAPLLSVYNNRSIEKLFSAYSSYRFFLAKENLREVIVTR